MVVLAGVRARESMCMCMHVYVCVYVALRVCVVRLVGCGTGTSHRFWHVFIIHGGWRVCLASLLARV